MPSRHDLVLVSAGFEPEGGGRAAVGRLLRRVCSEYAEERGIGLEVLCLRGVDGSAVRARSFRGSAASLAWAVARRHTGRPRAFVYDLLGLARTESLLPHALRRPYLLMLLGIEVWRPLSWSRRTALLRARRRLAISRYTLERARRLTPGLEADVVHLSLEDDDRATPLVRGSPQTAAAGYLLMVGRMSRREQYKGHDQVLGVLPQVIAARPETRLVIAGDGDDRQRLEQRTRALGLDGRVDFVGFVDAQSLRELYQGCAALLLPSRGEGFGLVLLEAMRAGKPCIALSGSAAEEIVVDGDTGWLVEQDSPAELAAACMAAISPAESLRRGAAGHRRWQEHYAFARFRGAMFRHLDDLTLADVRH